MIARSPFAVSSFWGAVRRRFDDFASAKPARFGVYVFTALILVWAFLLALPISSASGSWTNLVDALFTAVSVICVTGLSTVDMALQWSQFGHVLVFTGVQIGAMGVMTLASTLGLVFSRRFWLKSRLIAAADGNTARQKRGPISESQAVRLSDIGGLLVTIAVSTVAIETIIALLMMPSMFASGMAAGDAIWQSFYYSVMSFTNTGFTSNIEGLEAFSHDYWLLGLMMFGVFLGSLGFPVFFALVRQFRHRQHWSLHVKLTLSAVFALFVLGGLLYMLLELGNSKSFNQDDPVDYAFNAFYLSMMTRSGGFSLIDPNDLTGSGKLLSDMLMFVGGGSASTAGGIKVTTLAVIFLAIIAEARGRNDIEAFGRRIPADVLRIAVSVLLLSATTIALASMTLMALTEIPLDRVLFDTISAFGTVGLSTGVTSEVNDLGKMVLIGTMWMGRIGTLTLAMAISAKSSRQLFRRPEERPIVG